MQNLGDIATNLHHVMIALKRWSREKFGAVNKELTSIRKEIEELSMQDGIANQVRLRYLNKHMDELLYREEMMWLRRSWIAWLKGDRNTKFFHRKAEGR
jgi:hypothetical protein